MNNLHNVVNVDINCAILSPHSLEDNNFDNDDISSATLPPQNVAHEYIIQKICLHRGIRSDPNNLEFLVRWENCGPSENTWESYHNLKETAQLHIYLKAHRMVSLIPYKFKNETYEVEKILKHTGTNNLQFKVKWKGYSNACNTLEPYESLKHLTKLHVYLKKHNMEHLIPYDYRN